MIRKAVKPTVAALILLFALFCLIFGLLGGGFDDVLNKARMICFECIGLG